MMSRRDAASMIALSAFAVAVIVWGVVLGGVSGYARAGAGVLTLVLQLVYLRLERKQRPPS